MFIFNRYKYFYRIVAFAKDGFYIHNPAFDSLDKPFFYKCKLKSVFKPSSGDYRIYYKNSSPYLGLRHPIDFTKPWLYQ